MYSDTKEVRTLRVLRAARKLVASAKTWTLRYYALTSWGQVVNPADPNASCFCGMGAVCHAIASLCGFESASLDPGITDFYEVPGFYDLEKALNVLSVRLYGMSLYAANDRLGRVAALAVLDAAILELSVAGD